MISSNLKNPDFHILSTNLSEYYTSFPANILLLSRKFFPLLLSTQNCTEKKEQICMIRSIFFILNHLVSKQRCLFFSPILTLIYCQICSLFILMSSESEYSLLRMMLSTFNLQLCWPLPWTILVFAWESHYEKKLSQARPNAFPFPMRYIPLK